MQIEVRLFAYFREGRFKNSKLEIEKSITVLDILNRLNINKDDASIILINGKDGELTSTFNDNDVLSLFPPVGGG